MVSDTGCGIPKDELDNIFARFVQLSEFLSKESDWD